MPKVVMYEGYGDPLGLPSKRRRSSGGDDRPRRRHSSHVIKSAAVRKQNKKMEACALEWRKDGKRVKYREHMKECLRR